MTRLNVSFTTDVHFMHPFILMRPLSVLSILGLYGIPVTLASSALKTANINPAEDITGLGPVISNEAKKALELANIHADTAVTSVFAPKQLDPAANTLDLAKAMHNHVSTQLFDGKLSPADALAAQPSIFQVAKPSLPAFGAMKL